MVRQHLHYAYWRRGVGVDGIDHADAAHIDHRITAKFRVIDNQHNVARVLNNAHADNTSELGLFKIVSESGVGAGVRRIEAVTSKEAYEFLQQRNNILNE